MFQRPSEESFQDETEAVANDAKKSFYFPTSNIFLKHNS